MKWLVLALVLCVACGGAEGGALELGGELGAKEGGGKMQDGRDAGAELATDAGQAVPDAGGATPDAGKPAQDAQAPRADADAPMVDAAPAETLAGAWRVTLAPLGMPCAGARGGPEEWKVSPAGDTVATDWGTLSRLPGGTFEGINGAWVLTAMLALDDDGFAGQFARKGVSCSDRWELTGVRP